MENPIKTDDLGVPLFLETPISCVFIDMFLLVFNLLMRVPPASLIAWQSLDSLNA